MGIIVLIAITGELGVGKSLALAYLCWNNWYFKRRTIATNFNLYGIPHIKIKTIEHFFKFIPEKETEEDILKGEEKFFGGDDFWRWISSRCIGLGSKQKNEIISRILMASRKAFVTVTYTTQLFSMIDKNIRQITDLLMKPQLSADHSYCKVYVYGIIEGKYLQPLQPFYFNTEPIIAIYNTYERAGNIVMDSNPEADIKEVVLPIEKNPAWKKYCLDLGIDISSKEFLDKCKEVIEGLKRGVG